MKRLFLLPIFAILLAAGSCTDGTYGDSNPIKEKSYKDYPTQIIDSVFNVYSINQDSVKWLENKERVQFEDKTIKATVKSTLYRLPVDSTLVVTVIEFNDSTYVLRFRIEKEEEIDY